MLNWTERLNERLQMPTMKSTCKVHMHVEKDEMGPVVLRH